VLRTGREWVSSYPKPPIPFDPDPERYVKPTKEQLRTMVGTNPRFLVKDNWAAYGCVGTGLRGREGS
jgi:hypothetical protein